MKEKINLEEEKEMEKLKCKKCGWVWEYRGRKSYYATCPNCRRSVNIRKEKYQVEG